MENQARGCERKMALFINSNGQPGVYKNRSSIKEPNQSFLRIDYLSEMVEEQKNLNENLVTSLKDLKLRYERQKQEQWAQWKDVGNRLHKLTDQNHEHKEFEKKAKEWLKTLEDNNAKLHESLQKESELNSHLMEQIQVLNESHHDVWNKLSEYETSNQKLHNQMRELMEYQKQLLDQVKTQDEKQDQMIDKLENQEAIMEKTFMQVSHLRSVLYERASYLADKMEESYNMMANFFYNLISGRDPSLNLFMLNKKKEEAEEPKGKSS